MDLTSNDKLYGVIEGVAYGQYERVDEINNRMSSRHFSDSPLEPNFDPRPVPTKYSVFPIVDRRKVCAESSLPYINYNSANFNPGNARAPPSGILQNIDTETILRNQTFAMQKGAEQNVYVPSSNSELYKVTVPYAPSEQTHPLLFSQYQFDNNVHPNNENGNIGRDQFFNHTRTQLRSFL